MINTRYIITKEYTENLKQVWKLVIKDGDKIKSSLIYDSLPKINKAIQENENN